MVNEVVMVNETAKDEMVNEAAKDEMDNEVAKDDVMVNEEDNPADEEEDRATDPSVCFVTSLMPCLNVLNGWTNPRTNDFSSVSVGATRSVHTASLQMLVTGTMIVQVQIMTFSVHVAQTSTSMSAVPLMTAG